MSAWIETALGREERPEPMDANLDALRKRGLVLITGGLGSLGLAVSDVLDNAGIEFVATDLREMDVTSPVEVDRVMGIFNPATILHLAGAKHAPLGEIDPEEPVQVHVNGTSNVIAFAPEGARVVTASTCKSCDPETAYGASKLIAERLTLNAGHRVARFHNVVDTSGNVFEKWRALGDDDPLEVTGCNRYLISTREAVALLLHAAAADEPGRYMTNPGPRHDMHSVAYRLYPGRRIVHIEARRGDRMDEPFTARCERTTPDGESVLRVHSPYDAQVAA